MTGWRSGSPNLPLRRISPGYAPIWTATRSCELLDIPAGPQVGEAWRYLKELRLDRGPLTNEEATAELLAWWNSRENP